MSDIVERLRDEATRLSGRSIDRGCVDSGIASNLANAAADEIERLREELEARSPFVDGYDMAKDELMPRLIAAECEVERLRALLSLIGATFSP